MKPLKNFEAAMTKAEHLFQTYSFLSNTRKRTIRKSWIDKFKKLMLWPSAARVMRIDGANSVLFIKDAEVGLTYGHFEHAYASEILKASIVFSVSALDKYLHDQAVLKCYSLLTGAERDIPKSLLKIELPALSTIKAMQKIRVDPTSRPGSQIKKALQAKLHQSTFQSSTDVDRCVALMNVKKFWSRTADNFIPPMEVEKLKKKLNDVVMRRNYIVHEADIVRQISSSKVKFREIKQSDANDAILFIREFVVAADPVINQAIPIK